MNEYHDVRHTVASHFARCHLDNGVSNGLNPDELLGYASLSPALLQQQGSRIAPKQLARLMLKIMRDCDDEFLGLSAQPCRLGVFRLLCERLISCSTLLEAMQETQRFYDLIDRGIGFELIDRGDEVQVTIVRQQAEKDVDHILIEYLLLVWHRFPSWLIGQVIPLKKVQFDFAEPAHAEEYRLLYPGPREFNCSSNSLIWPKAVLQLPIHRTAEQLKRYMTQVPLQWFRKQRFSDHQTERVMQLLEQSSNPHQTTLEDIAEQLHMTSRTLRRKLTAEGSRFQQMKDDLRRDQAIYWLSQEGISINEAGEKVGYTETASFIRAFKGWTGMSPGRYQRGLYDAKAASAESASS
ncbi:MAG: AraC family transcriptional regulator [Cellvibrionaceae bacterium]